MQNWFILIFLSLTVATSTTQAQPTKDSNNVHFVFNANDVTRQYKCGIVFSNTTSSPVKIYEGMVLGYENDKFANCDIIIEKNVGGVYADFSWFFANSSAAEEVYPELNFDLRRKILLPNSSDTLYVDSKLFEVNPVGETVSEFRFKVRVRVDFEYPGTSPDPGKSPLESKVILYKESPWFYFLPH